MNKFMRFLKRLTSIIFYLFVDFNIVSWLGEILNFSFNTKLDNTYRIIMIKI
jgi:hypothetical protein